MIEDLKLDTTELTDHIRLRMERDVMIDSWSFCSPKPISGKRELHLLSWSDHFSTYQFFSQRQNHTTAEKRRGLKAYPQYGYIQQYYAYDRTMRQSVFELGDEQQVRGEYRLSANKIFSGQVFHQMMKTKDIKRPIVTLRFFLR
jgi:hypothetical protein